MRDEKDSPWLVNLCKRINRNECLYFNLHLVCIAVTAHVGVCTQHAPHSDSWGRQCTEHQVKLWMYTWNVLPIIIILTQISLYAWCTAVSLCSVWCYCLWLFFCCCCCWLVTVIEQKVATPMELCTHADVSVSSWISQTMHTFLQSHSIQRQQHLTGEIFSQTLEGTNRLRGKAEQ